MQGSINYQTGRITIADWSGATQNALQITSAIAKRGGRSIDRIVWRVPSAPVLPGSLQLTARMVSGEEVQATADSAGNFNTASVQGSVDYQTGIARAYFGRWADVTPYMQAQPWFNALNVKDGKVFQPLPVLPESLTYNATAVSYVPMDDSTIGIDTARLPPDGRVPFIRPGDILVLSHMAVMAPATVSNGQTLNTGRVRVSRVRVTDVKGLAVTAGYTANLDAGTVTFTDVAGYQQPITVTSYTEGMHKVSDVQIDGTVTLASKLTHDYPAGAVAATALVAGDQFARVQYLFDQESWDGKSWSDALVGNPASATYNTTLAPVIVTNAGAVTERWALKFKNDSQVEVIGEHVGNLGIFSINTDIAPPNPNAGNAPYFTAKALGFGGGWIGGNAIFIKTVGAVFPAWVLECVNPGQAAVLDHQFELTARFNVDRPGADQT